jgi:hypothetical protein
MNLLPEVPLYFGSYRSSQNNITKIAKTSTFQDDYITFSYQYNEHGLPSVEIDCTLYLDPVIVTQLEYIYEEYY